MRAVLKDLFWVLLILGLLSFAVLADGVPTSPGQSPVNAQSVTPGVPQGVNFNISGTGRVGTKFVVGSNFAVFDSVAGTTLLSDPGGSGPAVTIGTAHSMIQSEALVIRSPRAGIGIYTPGIGQWSIFNNLSNVLEINTENDDGSNPQTQCQFSVNVGDPNFGCVSRIEAPSIRAKGSGEVNFSWYSSDNPVNRKAWQISAATSSLDFKSVNDSQSASLKWLSVKRSGGGDGSTYDAVVFPSLYGPTIFGADRSAGWGAGAGVEFWNGVDFLTSATSGPNVRMRAVAGTGFVIGFYRAGSADVDERMLLQDQGGNTFATFDAVAKQLSVTNGSSTSVVSPGQFFGPNYGCSSDSNPVCWQQNTGFKMSFRADHSQSVYLTADSSDALQVVAPGGLGVSNLAAGGVVTNTSAGLLGTLPGTVATVLHGNASGTPTFSAVSLTADVTGLLPFANMAGSRPFCDLSGGAPSTCTATVLSGSKCTCSLDSSTLSLAVGCDVSGTTATVAAIAGATGRVQLLCF